MGREVFFKRAQVALHLRPYQMEMLFKYAQTISNMLKLLLLLLLLSLYGFAGAALKA